ncbi:hypothetical protein HDE_13624 [Halotydeus destructor]|nr:hypothetical protein HDE_13624 [Halotydeus destructor]
MRDLSKMLTNVALCLIVLTTVSSQPLGQSFKYHVSDYFTRRGKEIFQFNANLKETFPEAQRLCALYGGQVNEPSSDYDLTRRRSMGTHWINSYFDETTATWRWVSDQSPVEYRDLTKPVCKGEDCAHYRQYVEHYERVDYDYPFDMYFERLVTTDVRQESPIKAGIVCQRPVA